MPDHLSGPLAAWTSAWIAGSVSLDQVVDLVTGDDAPHRVSADEPELDGAPLSDVLVRWRRSGVPVRAVFPAPGDVRGLPPAPGLAVAATDAGEATVGGGLALVPERLGSGPSSAPDTVLWHAFPIATVPMDYVAVSDAQYDLVTAIRTTASALTAAQVAGGTQDVEGLSRLRRAGEEIDLPPGFPASAVALVAQAERMSAVLELALLDPVGGAIDRHGITARTEALRPLAVAVRRALVAGWNAGAETSP